VKYAIYDAMALLVNGCEVGIADGAEKLIYVAVESPALPLGPIPYITL